MKKKFNYLLLALAIISSRNVYADFDVRSIKWIFKALDLEFKIWLIMNFSLPSSLPEFNDLLNIT